MLCSCAVSGGCQETKSPLKTLVDLTDVKEAWAWAAGYFAHLSKVKGAVLEPVCPDSSRFKSRLFSLSQI